MGSQEIACQDLLKKGAVFNSWLRKKTNFHKFTDAMDRKMNRSGFQNLAALISWDKCYVVVNDGFLYIYKNETAKKPNRILDLCLYDKVEKELKIIKDVPWPFRVSSDHANKVMLLGASSEGEQQNCIDAIQLGIKEAERSGRKEKIIATEKERQRLKEEKRKSHVKNEEEHQSNSDSSDYDYIPDTMPDTERTERRENPKPFNTPPLIPGKNHPPRKMSNADSGVGVEYEIGHGITARPVPVVPIAQNSRRETPVPKPPIAKNASTGDEYELGFAKKPESEELQPRREKPVPQPPIGKNTPTVTAKKVWPPPVLSPKPISNNKEATIFGARKNLRPVVPISTPLQQDNTSDNEDEVQYELEDEETIVKLAVWTGNAEEGIDLMKTINEEGVYMIRDSSTGKGEKTLQVISDGAVRKYKISKEGNKHRLGGGPTFDSLVELLGFYQKNSIPNHTTKLTKPYSRVQKH